MARKGKNGLERESKPEKGGTKTMKWSVKEQFIARYNDNGGICFVRLKLEAPPLPDELSKDDKIGFAHWPGGTVVGVIKNIRRGLWVHAVRLERPQRLHQCWMHYHVRVGRGDKRAENVDEFFYFPSLPPEIARLKDDKEKTAWLAQCVMNLIEREMHQFQTKAAEIEKERLKQSPVRLAYEPPGVDHHKNQQQVALELLRKEWPHLSEAMDQCQASKTLEEKQKARAKVSLAYIADYTAVHGERPAVRKEEEAGLWRDDLFVRLLNDALEGPRNGVDKINWQLANGWIVKNYYRMNERELERAFARDWGYKKIMKGNTLARRAQRIGLLSALKRGRPEIHKFLDATL